MYVCVHVCVRMHGFAHVCMCMICCVAQTCMCRRMRVYVCVYVYVCAYASMVVCMHVAVCRPVYAAGTHMCMCVRIATLASMHACMHVSTYVYRLVCVNVYVIVC